MLSMAMHLLDSLCLSLASLLVIRQSSDVRMFGCSDVRMFGCSYQPHEGKIRQLHDAVYVSINYSQEKQVQGG
jgi:hypothetical protein